MNRRDFIAALAAAPALPELATGDQAPARAAKPLAITILGTGTPAPSLKRQSSGYLIEVGGDAIVYEGTVNWQILMNGDVLKAGHTQAFEAGPAQSPWQETVTLTPGTYTIRAFEVSAKDGSETYVDDKIVTVK